MSWLDRLREAAYNSPGGTRLRFNYLDVSKTIEKKTSPHEFPDADGTYVQDLGRTGNRFPIRVVFWGPDCDTDAEAFEATLLERGTGILEHPIYGKRDVVPFGEIRRRDDLKSAANQVVLELEFWETTGLVYPTPSADPGTQVTAAVDEYNEAAAGEFEEKIITDTALKRVTLKERITAAASAVKKGLAAVSAVQKAVEDTVNEIFESINTGIDLLVQQPLALANQFVQLVQAPARALSLIKARLDGYRNLFDDLIGTGDAEDENRLRTDDLTASALVSASIVSVVNNQFVTKTEAIAAAASLVTLLEDLIEWREDQFETLAAIDTGTNYPVVDTGEAFQKLQQAVALAAGYLVEISFSLKQERVVVLDRPRTIIDLCAELYGAVDSELDFFITSNDLTGDEILTLPAGREVKYYVI